VTEDQARQSLMERYAVSRETVERLSAFVELVIDENQRQNLISAASVASIWCRHILDSAQLLDHAPSQGGWVDLGSGAGFPGLVVGILRHAPLTLVESRGLRISFLKRVVDEFHLDHVTVHGGKVEAMPDAPFSVISARAFAPLDKILTLAHRFATPKTIWVLPKGQRASEELAAARKAWQGEFHVKQSITAAEASIIVARRVQRGTAK